MNEQSEFKFPLIEQRQQTLLDVVKDLESTLNDPDCEVDMSLVKKICEDMKNYAGHHEPTEDNTRDGYYFNLAERNVVVFFTAKPGEPMAVEVIGYDAPQDELKLLVQAIDSGIFVNSISLSKSILANT